MNILIVSMGHPTKEYPGNGIFEFDQAKALKEEGNNVVFMSLDLRSIRRKRKWGYQHFRKKGIEIYEVNIPCGGILKSLYYNVGIHAFSYLYKKINFTYKHFDIIHSHFTNIGYITVKAMEKIDNASKVVITEHSSLIHSEKINKKLFKIAEYAYRNSDQVIGVSNSLCKNIQKKFGIETIKVNNIVDTGVFDCVRNNEERKKDNTFNFISVGNLVKIKRMDLLIKTFYEFQKKNKNCFLTICGDGNEKKKLKKIISDLNLSKKIRLYGKCSREEISENFKNSDCFLLVSESETFGVVLIEAMASGIPVIATRCGGPEEFVHKENGILVEMNNKNQLLEAMESMYINSELYNSKTISCEIKSNFSSKNIAKKLEKAYIDIIQRGN